MKDYAEYFLRWAEINAEVMRRNKPRVWKEFWAYVEQFITDLKEHDYLLRDVE